MIRGPRIGRVLTLRYENGETETLSITGKGSNDTGVFVVLRRENGIAFWAPWKNVKRWVVRS